MIVTSSITGSNSGFSVHNYEIEITEEGNITANNGDNVSNNSIKYKQKKANST
jgi:hypothetical protein